MYKAASPPASYPSVAASGSSKRREGGGQAPCICLFVSGDVSLHGTAVSVLSHESTGPSEGSFLPLADNDNGSNNMNKDKNKKKNHNHNP